MAEAGGRSSFQDGDRPVHTFMVLTDGCPILVMTIHGDPEHPEVRAALERRGYRRFISWTVPVESIRSIYGTRFEVIEANLDDRRPLRILDFDGDKVFDHVVLANLDRPVTCDL